MAGKENIMSKPSCITDECMFYYCADQECQLAEEAVPYLCPCENEEMEEICHAEESATE